MTKRMVLIAVFVPPDWIPKLDSLIEQGYYPNRSEAIRMAIRDLLKHHDSFKKQTSKSKLNVGRVCGWWLIRVHPRLWHGWVMVRVWFYGFAVGLGFSLRDLLRELYFVVTGRWLWRE